MDNLDFLDAPEGAEPAAVQPAPEAAPQEPAVEAPAGPARGPDGKFTSAPSDPAPAEPAQPQTPAIAPEAAQPAPAEPVVPPGYVPQAALHEERRRRQALEEQMRQQPPQPAPDPYEDLEGYEAHQEAQRIAITAQWSQRLATATHGEEAVRAAQQWAEQRFETDPVFRQQALSHPDPYGFAIAEHQRDQAIQMFTDPKTIEAFRAWQSGQQAQPAQAPAAVPVAAPQPVAVPTSITGQPSAGGIGAVPLGDAALFDSVIPKG